MSNKPFLPVYGDSLVRGLPGYSFVRPLRDRVSDHRVINLGRTGDTLFSMRNRLRFLPLHPGDTAILCAGINDIYVRYAPQFKLAKALNGQWWTKDWNRYRDLLDEIMHRMATHYRRVIVIPPLLLGEDPDSPANRDLDQAEQIFRETAQAHPGLEFPEIRKELIDLLRKETDPNPVIANRLIRLIADVFKTRTAQGADRLSRERGYILTTDGVHFNSRGAALVADRISETLRKGPHSP